MITKEQTALRVVKEELFTKKEVASLLRCSMITVHRAIKQHRLGCYRIGSKVLIGESHIESFKRSVERASPEGTVA